MNVSCGIIIACLAITATGNDPTNVGHWTAHTTDRYVALSAEKRLTKHLLERYQQVGVGGRPVLNGSQPTLVLFGLGLIQVELDEQDKVMISSMWINMKWRDEYLQWNPALWGGVDHVRLNAGDIWVPDVMLINTADPKYEMRNSLILVHYNGDITWVPHMIFRSSCALNVTAFPFDKQNCSMWFGSWTHAAGEVDLGLANGGLDIKTFEADFHKSRSWDITNHSSVRIPPGHPEDYSVLVFTMRLERRLVFSGYILTLPCIFLAFLTLVVFCLPPERPDRTALAMSLFGSFLFLLLILVETAPPTAASVPKLGLYYCFNMVIIMLSIFFSTLVVNVNKLGDGQCTLPQRSVVVIDTLARLLLVNVRNVKCSKHRRDSVPSAEEDDLEIPLHERNGYNMQMPSHTDLLSKMNASSDTARCHRIDTQSDSATKTEVLLSQILLHVADIRLLLVLFLKQLETQQTTRKFWTQKGNQWRTLAAVLDRMFFVIYFSAIIWSLFSLFPWPEILKQD